MRRFIIAALGATLVVGVGGCKDMLSGPGLTETPNSPSQATTQQLFVAMQAGQFTLFEGQLARLTSEYTQQLAGTNNQQLQYGSQYLLSEGDINPQFNGFYTGGGLVDMRKIEAATHTAGDAQWEGITKIWEAFSMGTAASIWGDIAYREAASDVAKPHLDPQQQVYSDVQALLDEGIRLLAGAGPGPGVADLVYGGNTARWKAAAYTMKARFYLHLAEKQGTSAYQSALTAAQQGINEAPTTVAQAVHGQGPGDFRTYHGNTLSDANLWAQFLQARQDMVAGQKLLDILQARTGDPRLPGYFDAVTGTTYRGADQFGRPVGGTPSSVVNVSVRRAYPFRQPLVTWAENQLILAEARFQTGDAAGALTNLNNVRAAVGLAALPGPATLADIMTEKYIVQYQNIDAWSDYKRTCIPALKPGGASPTSPATEIPGRVPYGQAERQNNPNVPLPSAQPARNWDDPNPCPAV